MSAPGNKCVLCLLLIIYISCVKQCLFFLNLRTPQRGTILFPIVWVKRLCGWKKAQYAPLPCQSTRVTVCSQFCAWMGPLISKLCSHWALMCHLVVQRNLWHWRAACWIEYSPSMYVKWTLLREQGQSGNMLVIVVSCTQSLNTATVRFCWSHCCVIYCSSDSISSHLHSWLTDIQPHDWAYPPLPPALPPSVQAVHRHHILFEMLTGRLFVCCGLTKWQMF